MKIVNKNRVTVSEITNTLKNDGLVIMPTETMYGAFVDATNQTAVLKLTKYKNRPFGKPYSVAVTDKKMAEKYVFINKTANKLYSTFLPGPLTIISAGKHTVAPGVESETGTLGIRIPDYKLVMDVVNDFGKPLTATSANASYKPRPYSIDLILKNLSVRQKNLIDLVVNAGELPHKEPSTVIDTTMDDITVLRQGGLILKDKVEVLSKSEENTQNIGKELWQKYKDFHGKRAIVFALVGDMGAGKTQFAKGVARAMGIKDDVVSPTYDIEEEYDDGKLIHIDAWRMQKPNELEGIGFNKKITDKSVVIIEWADKVEGEIRKRNEEAVVVWLKILYGKGVNERILSWGVI